MNNPANIDEIEKLIRKAEKSRHAHFMISDSLNFKGRLLHTLILIGASTVAILTFANYKSFKIIIPILSENVFTFMIGALASLVFILSILEEFFRWKDIAREHEIAGKQLTTFIRDCDGTIKQSTHSKEQIDLLRSRYTQVNDNNPPIPDKYFLKAKQEYLIKVSISKELDDNPFLNVRKYKKEKRKKQG
jgi:hypothetical protein